MLTLSVIARPILFWAKQSTSALIDCHVADAPRNDKGGIHDR